MADYRSPYGQSRNGSVGEGSSPPADRRAPTASASSHSSSYTHSHPPPSSQSSYSSYQHDQSSYGQPPSGYANHRVNQPKLHLSPSSPEPGPHSAPPLPSVSGLPPPVVVPPRSATSPSPTPSMRSVNGAQHGGPGGGGRQPDYSRRLPSSSDDGADGDHGLAYLNRDRRGSNADGQSSGSESPYSSSQSGALGREGERMHGSSSSARARQPGAPGPSSSSPIEQSYSSHSHHHYGVPAPASRSGTPSSSYDGPRPPSTAPSSPPSAHSHSHGYPSQPHHQPQQSHSHGHPQTHLQNPQQQQSSTNPYSLGPMNSSSALSHASSHGPPGSASSHQSQPSAQNHWPAQQQPQTFCAACGHAVTGPFVRALKTVYHLDCFRCQDCNKVVAAKFFPIESKDGKQYPLCETDYFRRLDLICNSCGMALRGSYITACQKKFHVEHFTCSACPTLFGPQDSYYEHDGDVFCHFHYSTRFATKCVGCGVAILKQFVEINRNQLDECWHPECYMIQKFWNVKLLSRFAASANGSPSPSINGHALQDEEEHETADSLKAKQQEMEQQVYQVWTVLSAFEESSAACISEMLAHVSNSLYMEAVNMAERFIFHVEVLFATIDELETHFIAVNAKGMSHVREAKLLCRTTVNFFSLLAHTHETGSRRTTGITADLLSLVTRLAHYLKILIRISLTGALKLEREHADRSALAGFLDRLSLLARDGGDPGARRRRLLKQRAQADSTGSSPPEDQSIVKGSKSAFSFDRQNYGYKSLFLADGESLLRGEIGPAEAPLDLCVACAKPVEEDCVRLGTYPHWHSHCVQCTTCGRAAALYLKEEKKTSPDDAKSIRSSPARKPRPDVDAFVFLARRTDQPATNAIVAGVPQAIFCLDHAVASSQPGFETVTRLEQFSFLLNAALRRLYSHLRAQGVVAAVPAASEPSSEEAMATSMYDAYKDSNDVKRMKSVNLDRKLSSTTAHVPKRSTVVESPSGKVAKSSGPSQPPSTSKVLPAVPLLPTNPSNQSYQGSVHHPQPVRPASSAFSARPMSQSIPPNSMGSMGSSSRDESPSGIPSSGSSDQDGPSSTVTSVIRPSFARNNTSVRIVTEPSTETPVDQTPSQIDPHALEEEFEEQLTLRNLPEIIEAEQARVEHRPSVTSDRKLIANLTPVQSLVIKYFAVIQLQKSPLAETFDLDEILDLVSKKNNFWNKLFKGGKEKKDKKEIKKKVGVFGCPLDQLVERAGSDSVLGATEAHLKVPTFVEDIISAMKQMDMSVEGIFRKNGNIRRLKDMVDALDRDPTTVSLADENPVQLAALLKKFLRDMPDPLLTFRLHRLFCQSQTLPTEAERRRYLHLIVCLLPRYNRDTMEIVFVFLKWVASFSHIDEETGSKMDLPNLSTVITPSILYSKGGNPLKDESFVAIKAVTLLLQSQDDFYTVPDELDHFLHDNIVDLFEKNVEQVPPKELLKRAAQLNVQIQNHRRTQHQGRGPSAAHIAAQMPLPPSRGDTYTGTQRIPSYRSDNNLAQSAQAQAQAGGGGGPYNAPPSNDHSRPMSQTPPSRPASWAQQQQSYDSTGSGGSVPRPGMSHQPFSHSSAGQDSPSSPRRQFTGAHSPLTASSTSHDQHDPRRSYQPPAHANTYPQPGVGGQQLAPSSSDPQRS